MDLTRPPRCSWLLQVCENPGELVCCDSCNLAYHWACLKRPGEIPREFVCPECREKYTVSLHPSVPPTPPQP